MNYYSEKDIQDIVARVIANSGLCCEKAPGNAGMEVPVEISARHVHLDQAAVDVLFGPGYQIREKRPLSQPGQYLAEERIKLVTAKGEMSNVAILGPLRKAVQVELSLSDARALGIKAPVNQSGDLSGAGDVILIGPKGVVMAKGSVIVAKAHIHMTPADAEKYKVVDGEKVSVRMNTERPVTIDDVVVRVSKDFALAMHIDFDEANAALVGNPATGILKKG